MYTMQRISAFLIGALLACAAGAQPGPDEGPPGDNDAYYDSAPAQGQADPPARVARLAYMNGSVSFTPAGETEWVEAQLNRPLVTGDKLWTDDGAHAELQIGPSIVEIGDESSFDFLNLDDQLAQMELTQGELNLRVPRLRGNEVYEVDTPTIAFVVNRVGDYRIDVEPDGATVVTARRGGGDAVGEGGRRVAVEEGQSVRFNDSQLNDYVVNEIGPPDQFDHYVRNREERLAGAQPRGYVSEDVTGYEDLDYYGAWDDSPEYGHVWYPSDVPDDWAPYHYGQWEWIDPWGWTWVDAAPWGFAPFHYGRWAYIGSRWGWVPGPLDVEPVYAPALVAFIGGGGWGVSISSGGPIGWFALGPRDVYFPGYRCGRDYFLRVNIGNSHHLDRRYVSNYYGDWSRGRLDFQRVRFANRDAPRAIMAVNRTAFVAGRPVASARIDVNRASLANATIMARPRVMPTRQSLLAGRPRGTAPPARVVNRTVVAAHQPPPPRPSFAQRQPLLQRTGGQPLSVAQLHTLGTRAAPGGGRAAAQARRDVRVVGMAGRQVAPAAAPQRAAGPGAPAEAPRAQGPQRGTVSANGRRNEPGTRSRAIEMNRAPASANAQYPRSAGFAHGGVAPGSERAAQAQQNARGPQNARSPEERAAPRNRAPPAAQAHVPSAGYVRGQARANERAARADELSRGNAPETARGRGNLPQTGRERANVPERASVARERARSQEFATPSSNTAARAQRERPNIRGNERATMQQAERAPVQRVERGGPPRETRPSYVQQPRQAPQNREPTRAAPQNRPSYVQERRAMPQNREPPRAAPQNRPSYVQQPRAMPQNREPPRAAPQNRPSYVQQPRAMPQNREPPPRAQAPVQRSQPQQTARAKQSAPRGEPRRNEKDKDRNGGG